MFETIKEINMIGIGLTIFLLVFNNFTKYLKRFLK